MASTRTLTKSALSALRSSRAAKLSLSQSGSLLHRSRAARAVSTFTSPLYLSSRTRVFDGIAENDVVSVKLSLASGGGFARRFHSSTPLQSSAASSASQANQDEFTDMAWEGFINAFDAAIVCGQKVVDSEHLMKSLLELNGDLARRIFTKAGSDYFSVWQATEDFISQQPQVTDRSSARDMGPHIVSILDNALKIKKQMGDDFASVEHLLMAFHSDKRFGQELFKNLELTEIKLKDAITDIRGNHKVTNRRPGELYEALKKYGNDLTELARRGKLDPVVGRDDEIRQCIQILSRRTKNNPVIIGEPGVGKTAIAGGLAQRIMRGDVPEPLLNRKISSADYERGCSRTTAK